MPRLTAVSFPVQPKPTGDLSMTQNEFTALCAERTIDPSIALENDNLVEALKARDDEAVVTILDNEF
jgi:hypothetical protein